MRATNSGRFSLVLVLLLPGSISAQSPHRGFMAGGFSLFAGGDFEQSDPGPGAEIAFDLASDGVGLTLAGIGATYAKIGAKDVPLRDEANYLSVFGELRRFLTDADSAGNNKPSGGFIGLRLGIARTFKDELSQLGVIGGAMLGAITSPDGPASFVVTIYPAYVWYEDARIGSQGTANTGGKGFRMEITAGVSFRLSNQYSRRDLRARGTYVEKPRTLNDRQIIAYLLEICHTTQILIEHATRLERADSDGMGEVCATVRSTPA